MGYIRHHAILVTSWSSDEIKRAHAQAVKCFGDKLVSWTETTQINGYGTFTVIPDGSKEGWPESDQGDERRDQFIDWLNQQRHTDGSGPFAWAEVQYGDENGINTILRHEALRS